MTSLDLRNVRERRTGIARFALCVLGASLFIPVACSDDSGGGATGPGMAHGGEGGQGTPSGGKASAGGANVGGKSGGSSGSGGSATPTGGSDEGGMSNPAGGASAGAATNEGGVPSAGNGPSGGADSGRGGESPGASGAAGSGTTCEDVLPNAGCADANPDTVDGQSKIFGGCVHINQVTPGHGWVAYESFGVDIASGLAFVQKNDIKSHADIEAACAAMNVQGVSNWRMPTIDEARLLAGGCAPTAPDGTCPLDDPACLSSTCGFKSPECESCIGNQGPHKSKGYCRPEVPFCLNAATSSACEDCPTPGFWTYGIINGNFYSAKASDTMFTICVKENVAGALPCSL
ncbi:MAG TPA: hypothetical protein VHB79_18685 [Polyangiaceae bacterium]|nr:hypothetical protein [Polyangiaceae bacterium]